MGRHVLITGGAGFIGRYLADGLRQVGDDVHVVDDLSASPWGELPGAVDVRDVRALRPSDLEGIDTIVHLAARKSVPDSFDNRSNLLDNIDVDRHVLELVRSQPVRRVLLATSCEIYGNRDVPLIEELPPHPRSPYAVGKAATELLAAAYSTLTPTELCCFRLFNTYGPGEGADAVVPRFARDALAHRQITIEGDGLQRRFFSHVDEVVAILRRLIEAPSVPGVVNVAAGEEASVLEVARIVAAEVGGVQVVHAPGRPNEINRFVPDLQRLWAATGPLDARPLAEGVHQCVAWESRALSRNVA